MTWKDRLALGVLVAALAVVAAGILTPVPARPPSPTMGPLNTQAAFREGVLGRPSSINPLTVRTQVDRDLVALLFRGLLRVGPAGELLPDLADHWTATPDGRTYVFYLRPDAYWHDGIPVTARDVVFTIELLQDSGYDGTLGGSWTGVTATYESEFVVRFDLGIPRGGFLLATTLPLLPEHILAGTKASELADSPFSQSPLGNGPFRLIELNVAHAVLERVRYVDPAPPLFSTPADPTRRPEMPTQFETLSDIELRFFDSQGAMLNELQQGRLEAVGGLSGANLAVALKSPNLRLIRYPRPTLTAVILNQLPQRREFRSVDVRAGLLAAIDRDTAIRGDLYGYGTRADVPVPPGSWAYDASAVSTMSYSPASAEASLLKGGWEKGGGSWLPEKGASPLTLHLVAPDAATNRVANSTARRVAADWTAIGLAVDLRELPSAEYIDAIRTRAFDAAVVDVDLGLDPDLTPLLSSAEAVTGGSNLSGYRSPQLDKLLVAAASKVDPAVRKAAMSAVETFLSANTPILPLYFHDYAFVVSKRIENVGSREIADPSGRYWDVIDWRLASDR